MSKQLPIRYNGFSDFPLAFIVRWEGRLYGFLREFDDDQDDYEDHYRVYLLRPLTDEEMEASWPQIESCATHSLGRVAVPDVLFDSTHRRGIDSAIFQNLALPREPVGALR